LLGGAASEIRHGQHQFTQGHKSIVLKADCRSPSLCFGSRFQS
jgi:hypothetical protein